MHSFMHLPINMFTQAFLAVMSPLGLQAVEPWPHLKCNIFNSSMSATWFTLSGWVGVSLFFLVVV